MQQTAAERNFAEPADYMRTVLNRVCFMTESTVTRERRSRWPLFVMPALVAVLFIGWTVFWFFASSQVNEQFDRWRAREAEAGRGYECGKLSVGGYPFRFEVRCDNAVVKLASQTASRTFGSGTLPQILAVAQIYNPRLMIAEFSGPAIMTEQGSPTSLRLNWSAANSSVYGFPEFPQRGSLVVDDFSFDLTGAAERALGSVKKAEFHARIAEGSADTDPVIEVATLLTRARAPGLHPLAAQPMDAVVQGKLRGLKDFRPKPWPDRFREIQAAGGRIEIQQSRIQQGELIAVSSGSLGITPQGMLDGELTMTVVGLDKIIPALGLDKVLDPNTSQEALDRIAPGMKADQIDKAMGALDRLVPGLGNIVRQRAPAALNAGIGMIGQKTVLEGKPAQTFPLRFVEGAVLLGPLRVAQTPPLF